MSCSIGWAGIDLSPIGWCGQAEAENWFAMRDNWGEERQAAKLREMIKASVHDPDYWDALNLVAIRFIAKGEPLPDVLADWTIERSTRISPSRQSLEVTKGRRITRTMLGTISSLLFLTCSYIWGWMGKPECYDAIAEERGISERTVQDAIKKGVKFDGKLPAPWECWPPKS